MPPAHIRNFFNTNVFAEGVTDGFVVGVGCTTGADADLGGSCTVGLVGVGILCVFSAFSGVFFSKFNFQLPLYRKIRQGDHYMAIIIHIFYTMSSA